MSQGRGWDNFIDAARIEGSSFVMRDSPSLIDAKSQFRKLRQTRTAFLQGDLTPENLDIHNAEKKWESPHYGHVVLHSTKDHASPAKGPREVT